MKFKNQESGWKASMLVKSLESSLLTVIKLKGIKAKSKQK